MSRKDKLQGILAYRSRKSLSGILCCGSGRRQPRSRFASLQMARRYLVVKFGAGAGKTMILLQGLSVVVAAKVGITQIENLEYDEISPYFIVKFDNSQKSVMEALFETCKLMPKVELHAHLNGCIREETLQELQGGPQVQVIPDLVKSGPRELSECFELFSRVHKLITNPEILRTVTKIVIEDFHRDNVVYLELRTTPKAVHDISSKELYISSVIQGIQESQHLPIVVKLIVSIDRRTTAEEAIENVDLAIHWREKHPDLVVGMELSGDPTKGKFQDFQVAFEKARKAGLRITLHLPEVFNEAEALLMMSTDPDRVGHAVHIHPGLGGTYALWNMLKSKQIPVEVCLTSNVVARCSESYQAHHAQYMIQEGMPFAICTDDTGVFRTTLSEEFINLVTARNLKRDQLKSISVQAIEYAFVGEKEKQKIRELATAWWADRDTNPTI